jgi:hypothetical protein
MIRNLQLQLSRKIWSFHGSDYEEWRLLGYKNRVRTSQETHYFSTIESSQLMLCKIWGFHGSDYEEWRLLGYKNRVRTSQETHYVSATESSRLMLCKIWGFHGSDYEECRLLGYKNPVHTSQGTHSVSATESSQLMLYKIRSFNGGDYEECLVGCYAVWLLLRTDTVFLRSVLRLLVTDNVVRNAPIVVTLMMEAILSSETYFLTRATPRSIPEDGFLLYSRRFRNCCAFWGVF